MEAVIRQTLFSDPEDIPPAGFCPECGGELYAPSLCCLRCERRMP